MDGGYYWETGSIISRNVGGGEMQYDGLYLDVSHEALVGSLLCGKGSQFCVNKSFGVGKAVLINSLI